MTVFGPTLARLLLRVVTVHSLDATLPAIEAIDLPTANHLRRELAEQVADLTLARAWLAEPDAEVLLLAERGLRDRWLTTSALTSLVDSRRECDVIAADVRLWLEAARDAALPEV